MKTIKYFLSRNVQLALLATGALMLGSCLKDNGPVEDFSQSPALIGFQFYGDKATPLVTSILPGTNDTVKVEVTLSVASLTLNKSVVVTVVADQASLTAYNTANGTTYTMIPSNTFTLLNSGKVTIAAGQQIVNLVVVINESLINFASNPALALKITDASGLLIASNLNVAIMPLKLRNPYEGSYTTSGYFVHPASPRFLNATKTLSTLSAIRSEGQLGDLGGWYFDFDVNGSNQLVNWGAAGATNPSSNFINGVDNASGDVNYPGPPYVYTTYNNTYVPATHTFWMHYGYSGSYPAYSREVYEKWVLQ